MFSVLLGAVMNIVLDPVFIFALDMGVRGAAIATVISQACSCATRCAFCWAGARRFASSGPAWNPPSFAAC